MPKLISRNKKQVWYLDAKKKKTLRMMKNWNVFKGAIDILAKHRSMLICTLRLVLSKNLKILSYNLLPMAGKIPGSLIRLPTITSKTRRSVKLFHFITSSSFFPAIRHFSPFLYRYYQLYYFVLFWWYTYRRRFCLSSLCSRVLLNFEVKSFSYQIDVWIRRIFISLLHDISVNRIYYSCYRLKLQYSFFKLWANKLKHFNNYYDKLKSNLN